LLPVVIAARGLVEPTLFDAGDVLGERHPAVFVPPAFQLLGCPPLGPRTRTREQRLGIDAARSRLGRDQVSAGRGLGGNELPVHIEAVLFPRDLPESPAVAGRPVVA